MSIFCESEIHFPADLSYNTNLTHLSMLISVRFEYHCYKKKSSLCVLYLSLFFLHLNKSCFTNNTLVIISISIILLAAIRCLYCKGLNEARFMAYG